MKTDYTKWKFRPRDYLEIFLVSWFVTLLINVMCYRSWWAFLLEPLVFLFCRKTRKDTLIRSRKEILYDHFRDLIAFLHSSMRSGYSLENAVAEAKEELEQSYGTEDILVRELQDMVHQMELSIPVEKLFTDLAERSGIEDMEAFADVLTIGKRTGGNLCEVFSDTWDVFCSRMDTTREIRAETASRRFEQNIMSLIPFGILLYVQISFPEFLDILYGSVTGKVFMTGCLLVYLAAWVIGKKILTIEI